MQKQFVSKTEPLHLVHLKGHSIFEQLQWEEALLRTDVRNWCLVNAGSPPAIVMGISGQLQELVNHEKLKNNPIPVIRRFSGGGTVVVDDQTLFVTFICNKSFVQIPPYPEPIMQWTEEIYRPLFNLHPFELKENDYVAGEKKFGGNAQSIVKQRWLHHSSFLYDYHQERMDYLKVPKKAPDYRQARTHEDFLCCLKDYWPSIDALRDQLTVCLKSHFDVREEGVDKLVEVAARPHRKATTLILL